jgi:hypothetical protein
MDPDPDPHKNVTDPQQCLKVCLNTVGTAVTHFSNFLTTNICFSPTAGVRLLKRTVKMAMNVVF